MIALHAAPPAAAVNFTERTIRGLIVPYNKVGRTSVGRLVYAAGSVRWNLGAPDRVKLLIEHAQAASVGHAVNLTDSPTGLWSTFHVPPGDAGDVALANAASKVRDGLSIGVELDDRVVQALMRARGAAVMGAGALRETSLVSVPAYDDARVAAVA